MSVIGHQSTWTRLDRALREDRLAHALILTGPPGIGKRLFAIEFAKRVACETESGPCNDCEPCLQIEAESYPDLWIARLPDGKKEIGVDIARGIKHFAQLRGIDGATRLVVVEDADRLSVAAQNALLKTLEEPPGRAILMLVTDSAGALLSTVRSRCQRINFAPLSEDEVRSVLRQTGLDDAEIDPLAPLAQGSPGRALELRDAIAGAELEQLESALASLRPGRYGPVVDFAQALGRNEQEMTARLALLEDMLHQRLLRCAQHEGDREGMDRLTRALSVVSESRMLLRRRNPNRPLLAEAVGIKLARTKVAHDFAAASEGRK